MSTKAKVKIDYVEMWHDDKKCIIKTMVKNMNSDIQVGYSWLQKSIQDQINEITAYSVNYEREAAIIATMTPEVQQRWCKRDLIKRGAIE